MESKRTQCCALRYGESVGTSKPEPTPDSATGQPPGSKRSSAKRVRRVATRFSKVDAQRLARGEIKDMSDVARSVEPLSRDAARNELKGKLPGGGDDAWLAENLPPHW